MARWAGYDMTDFEKFYWDEVAPAMEASDLDPSEPPTRDWLVENNFSGFYQGVRRHTQYTFLDFCEQVIGITRGHDHVYLLSIEESRTRELAYRYAERHLMGRKGRGKNSVRNVLYSTDRVAYALRETSAEDNLLVLGHDDTPQPYSFEKFLDAFDILDEEHADSSMMTIHSHVKNFYEYLLRRRTPVDYNPVVGIPDEFDWERDPGDPPAMSPKQVHAIATVAKNIHEQTLIVLHCAAGLRRNEVARIHREMIVFDPDEISTPIIEFDVRKNGPGTVNLVYGVNVLRGRIKQLEEKYGDDWNGYLFPSPNRNRHYLNAKTTSMHFDDLVERAARETDIEMTLDNGETPTPQTGRRYWYNQYTKGVGALIGAMKDVASEQGSTDPEVALMNYISKERRLTILRDHMAGTLSEAFEGTPVAPVDPDFGTADIANAVGETGAGADLYADVEDQETPIDRFIRKNTKNNAKDESNGWLSDVLADESGFSSGSPMKAAVAVTVSGVVAQLLTLI